MEHSTELGVRLSRLRVQESKHVETVMAGKARLEEDS